VSQNYARIILGSSAAADGIAHNVEEALDIVEKIGYPVLVRHSFVLGDRGLAYLKSQLASGNKVPSQGNIFVSLKDEDKQKAVPLIKRLVDMGYQIYATRGTSTMLYNEGIKTRAVFRISRGRPNLLDLIHDKEVQ